MAERLKRRDFAETPALSQELFFETLLEFSYPPPRKKEDGLIEGMTALSEPALFPWPRHRRYLALCHD
jgi:hypothetical protein